MAGLLVASISSGQIISRVGRYKIFPVIGTALAAIGVFLLSTIDPQTPRFVLSMYMVVLGLGLGCVMQVLVIAVQNAVEQRDLGVGTSSATFLRSMGASFGVAIFGAIFSNQLASNLKKNLPASALHSGINPASLEGNPAQLAHLPPAIHTGLINAVSESLHVVFLTAVPILVVAFFLTLLIKEVPLRTKAQGIPARRRAVGARGGDGPRRRRAGRSGGRIRAAAEPAGCVARTETDPSDDGGAQTADRDRGRARLCSRPSPPRASLALRRELAGDAMTGDGAGRGADPLERRGRRKCAHRRQRGRRGERRHPSLQRGGRLRGDLATRRRSRARR